MHLLTVFIFDEEKLGGRTARANKKFIKYEMRILSIITISTGFQLVFLPKRPYDSCVHEHEGISGDL
jgi:hypothetical protein